MCLHSFCTGGGLKSKLLKIGQGVVVLDTLHLRETGPLILCGEFAELQKQLRWGQMPAGFKQDFRYEVVGDLRPWGLDVRLSINKKMGDANSKIEIFDAGRKSKSAWLETITAFRGGDPLALEVMRADLCADTSAVSVGWCLSHVTIPYRRFQNVGFSRGETQDWRMGSGAVQGIYFGKRPNMVRIYDKRSELRVRFDQLMRSQSRELPALRELLGDHITFEGFAESRGYPNLPPRFTRIERQCSGARIPAVLGTLGSVVKNLPDFNPFDGYRISTARADLKALSFENQVKVRGFLSVVDDEGLQFARSQFNRASGRQYNRDWRWCEAYLPDDGCDGITPEALFEICRESTLQQLRG